MQIQCPMLLNRLQNLCSYLYTWELLVPLQAVLLESREHLALVLLNYIQWKMALVHLQRHRYSQHWSQLKEKVYVEKVVSLSSHILLVQGNLPSVSTLNDSLCNQSPKIYIHVCTCMTTFTLTYVHVSYKHVRELMLICIHTFINIVGLKEF